MLLINFGKNLKTQRKQTVTAIALIMILTVSAFMASMPTVNAHTPPWNIATNAFLAVSPNPVGVGQTVLVVFWLNLVPPTAGGIGGDRWRNFTVTVTQPDGTTQTLGPFTSDPVGNSYTNYVPTTVGTYTFQFSFPGQTAAAGVNPFPAGVPYVGDYYQPSTSPKVTLTVQQQQIQPYQEVPLPGPTQYWQRPINANNRGWASIGGNWLMNTYDNNGNYFNPYTTAPNSAHIVWTKPITFGGIMGGSYGSGGTSSYYTGTAYEPQFLPPIILQGRLYYNVYTAGQALQGFVSVDLRTGQQLWLQNGTGIPVTTQLSGGGPQFGYNNNTFNRLTLGQIYDYVSPNQYGGQAYLWAINGVRGTTRYDMYNAFTGQWILSITNCSVGTSAAGIPIPALGTPAYAPDGSLLMYLLDGTHNWLAMWNSSKVSGMIAGPYGTDAWQWRPPVGANLDWLTGIQWNVTVPEHKSPYAQTIYKVTSDVIIAYTSSILAPSSYQIEIGYDANTGQQIWVQNRTLSPGVTNFGLMGPAGEGVYTEFTKETMTWSGYDIYTGKKLWGPTEPYPNAFGMYFKTSVIAYGKLLALDYAGYVHAYDVHNGNHLWDFFTGSSGLETVYGTWPIYGPVAVADGKIFVSTGHTHLQPMFRGARLYSIDTNTGKELWSVSGWWNNFAVADGTFVAENGYDNQIYAFGQGQTATTVTATPGVGNTVTIQGTVIDQSPGQTCLGIPAAGTPAISDDSMSAWMEYMYMQQPKPTDATGVKVRLTAIGSSGNTEDLGTVTSDSSGMYKKMWTPTVAGEYTVKASFEGSESYWSSSSETAIGVSAAVTPSPSPTATVNIVSAEVFYAVSAILALLMIAVVILLVRKK